MQCIQVKVYYQNGVLDVFNLNQVEVGERAKKVVELNMGSEHSFRFDRLEEEGLRVDTFFYDSKVVSEEQGGSVWEVIKDIFVGRANRDHSSILFLVAPEDLHEVTHIVVDGEKLVWRFGNHLINGIKFYNHQEMYLGENLGSFAERALELYKKMQTLHPLYSDEELAVKIGVPAVALKSIIEHAVLMEVDEVGSEDDLPTPATIGTTNIELDEAGKVKSVDSELLEDLSNLMDDALDMLTS